MTFARQELKHYDTSKVLYDQHKGCVRHTYKNIPEVMTFKECCELLRVGKNTMLDLLHSRVIDGFRIGNRWRIPKESVIEFIERR